MKENSTINIYVANKTIFAENLQNESIAIYNTQGQSIASARNINGTFEAVVSQAGVYVVRAGGEVWKVVVK